MIALPPRTSRTYQILPHTDCYFQCLCSCLDLLFFFSLRLLTLHIESLRLATAAHPAVPEHGGSENQASKQLREGLAIIWP